jgi:phosphoribosylformylglycinamidine synthase I
MKFGIVQFPGSNCDYDCYYAIRNIIQASAEMIWHKKEKLDGYDCIVLPGGFTYGDYLRVGAIARYSPIMSAVIDFAEKGGLVLGICNGFQVLTEARLLPGALIRNDCLHFMCRQQMIRLENIDTPFTGLYQKGQVLQIPIAHGEVCYYTDQKTIKQLEANKQIVFRYCDSKGDITKEANPNGSLFNIAGICNKERNVLGLMPHPERCVEHCLGSVGGLLLFQSIIMHFKRGRLE